MTASVNAPVPDDAIIRRLPPRPAAVPSPVLAAPGARPVILRFSETAEGEWQERRSAVFSIEDKDGNVTEYTVLDNPTVDMALEWMELTRSRGVLVATSWMLEAMLGTDGHAALRRYKRLRPRDLGDIVKACTDKLVDLLNDPKDWD